MIKLNMKSIIFILIVIFTNSAINCATFHKPENKNLIEAASDNDIERVRSLIDAKAYVNAIDKYNSTALMKAAEKGHKEIVQLLIEANADLNIVNYLRLTALMLASDHGRKDITQLLLDAKADVNPGDRFGTTALMNAMNCKDITKLLLDADAKVNTINGDGDTALTLAANFGNKDVVRLLLQAGADLDMCDPTKNQSDINHEINNLLKNEPKRRDILIKERQSAVANIINTQLQIVDLSNISALYETIDYQDIINQNK